MPYYKKLLLGLVTYCFVNAGVATDEAASVNLIEEQVGSDKKVIEQLQSDYALLAKKHKKLLSAKRRALFNSVFEEDQALYKQSITQLCESLDDAMASRWASIVRWQKIRLEGLQEDLLRVGADESGDHVHISRFEQLCATPKHPNIASKFVRALASELAEQSAKTQLPYKQYSFRQQTQSKQVAEGAVFFYFAIDAEGNLGNLELLYSEINNQEFEQQLLDALKKLSYPALEGGFNDVHQLNFYHTRG